MCKGAEVPPEGAPPMARRARHAPGVLRAAAVGLLAGLVGAGLARAERAPTTTATPMGLVIPLYFHRDYSEWARVAEAAARIPVVAVVSDTTTRPAGRWTPSWRRPRRTSWTRA